MIWKTAQKTLDLSERAVIIGILNVTPDSFSDGGHFFNQQKAIDQALRLLDEGADILDVGGESTRPGASPVDAEEEMARVGPIIKGIFAARPNAMVSIDTRKALVAKGALDLGAAIINDVSSLGDPEMGQVVLEYHAGLILMHMQGEPQTMQQNVVYPNGVIHELVEFFKAKQDFVVAQGLDPLAIAWDPGIGFGKKLEHNIEICRSVKAFQDALPDRPLIYGVSRKAFLAPFSAADRDVNTAVLNGFLRQQGVRGFRVHNAQMNAESIRLTEALLSPS